MTVAAETAEILARLGVPRARTTGGNRAVRSPVTGEIVADLVDGRRPGIDLSMVEPARLAAAVA